jgi:uncharacterized membrane protein YdjX (TVP38/TMEM64 family)
MERLGQVQSGAVSKSFSRLGLCFVLALTALAIGAIVWHWDSIVASQGTLLVHLRAGGVVGPLWCVLAQALQVVIFIIPGEATQIAAGYVFGAWKGFLYAALGTFLGSVFNFHVGRMAGRSILRRFLSVDTCDKVDRALNSKRGKAALFILFLLPGTPKDAMCYALGLSTMSMSEFVVLTSLARTPALLASILFGAYASSRNYGSMIVVGVAVALAVAGCYWYERRRSHIRIGAESASGRS